jgi:hypothetical protein
MTQAAESMHRRRWRVAAQRSQERTRNVVGALGSLAFLIILVLASHFSGLTSIFLRSPPLTLPIEDADRAFHQTRTGRIVFVPRRGDLCGKILFNNETGSFRDSDPVSCQDVLPQSIPAVEEKRSFGASLNAVRDGFNKR